MGEGWESEERDDHGRFSGGGGGGGGASQGSAAEHAEATAANVGAAGSSSLMGTPSGAGPGYFEVAATPQGGGELSYHTVNAESEQAAANVVNQFADTQAVSSRPINSAFDNTTRSMSANEAQRQAFDNRRGGVTNAEMAQGSAQTHSDATAADTKAAGSQSMGNPPGGNTSRGIAEAARDAAARDAARVASNAQEARFEQEGRYGGRR